jgi:molybdopterin converting factor small subunit
MIELKYWGGMLTLTGKKEEKTLASDVNEVLSFIESRYGAPGLKEAKRMLIVVNGTNIQLLQKYKTRLSDGDTVAFMPLSAGG